MKKLITHFVSLCALLFFFSACQHEESLSPGKGNVTFSLSQATRNGGRISETAVPALVLLSIKDGNGKVQQNIKLSLFSLGQGYVSDVLELQTGSYGLVQFAILDVSNKIIYATPLEGSALAKYVNDPLPLEFTISQNTSVEVVPQVLPVAPTDVPGDFGYSSFSFDIVSTSATALIKANVKMDIGGVLYENVDAVVSVKGYDANATMQWTKDYNFVGPADNILEVQNGFHHYSIELVDKWGTRDIQSDIPGKAIWDGRADGALPVTYVLVGKKDAKKLSMYVTSMETANSEAGIVYKLESRISYSYNNDGRLEFIHHEFYNEQTSQFEETTTDAFSYEGDVMSKITTTLNGERYTEDNYSYGIENKVTETDYFNNGLVWTRTEAKNDSDNSIAVNYSYSSGASFTETFDIFYKNIISDKTAKSELCSFKDVTYDKNISPFRHLGYIDFYFENLSVNNKLTEDAHYVACAFPTLIPVSYDYTYDQDGYPVTKITTYKSGFDVQDNPNTNRALLHTQTTFYYK